MRGPNEAIQRVRHVMPTIEEIMSDLNGATRFSKLDLNQGYHQLLLDEDSRYITTFATHIGLRRYKRLLFGLNSASEIFQNAICVTIEGIPGTLNVSDDILVYGKTQKEHDERLVMALDRLRERGLTLNKAKCVFNKETLKYHGYIFSKHGVSPDPDKVLALNKAEPPTTPSEVRSLLGMANFCSRFIPDYATITEPLRQLTKKSVKWTWGENE